MTGNKIIRILFVCSGNICRSPMAEAVFRHLVIQAGLARCFEIASAGTDGWHVGESPHRGTQAVLAKHQIPLRSDKRAQRVNPAELSRYDYIIAMDAENLAGLGRYGRPAQRLLEFVPGSALSDVPDPYYLNNFDEVYRLVTAGCQGLLAYIRQKERL